LKLNKQALKDELSFTRERIAQRVKEGTASKTEIAALAAIAVELAVLIGFATTTQTAQAASYRT